MATLIRFWITISLVAMLFACSVPVMSQDLYGSPDANGSYGDSGDNLYGGNEQASQSPSQYGGNEQTSQSPNQYGGSEQTSQSPNQYGGSEQTSQSPSQYSGNEQTSQDSAYGPSVYGGSSSNSYGYDANGSGGSYGASEQPVASSESSGSSRSPQRSSPQPSQSARKSSPKASKPSQSSQDSSSVSSGPQTTTPVETFPPSRMTTFAVDIHFVAGYDLRSSYIAFHFCSGSPNITQCAIYNGVGSEAKLIAVEMVVTEDVFKTFSDDERRLWHSHEFPITSGIFVLPNLSPEEELRALQGVISTYGKVTNLYHPGTNAPTGVPALAYGWTTEDQVNEALVNRMEKILNLTTTRQERIEARKALKRPTLVEGHDEYLDTGFINEYDLSWVQVDEEGDPIQ